jgi:hypothetical protein
VEKLVSPLLDGLLESWQKATERKDEATKREGESEMDDRWRNWKESPMEVALRFKNQVEKIRERLKMQKENDELTWRGVHLQGNYTWQEYQEALAKGELQHAWRMEKFDELVSGALTEDMRRLIGPGGRMMVACLNFKGSSERI